LVDPLPVVIVFCDYTHTAPRYFVVLKRLIKQKVTLHIRPAPKHGMNPNDLLEWAQTELSQFREGDPPDDNSVIAFLLVDLERDAERESAACAAKAAEGPDLLVLRSEPCFELWTLLHIEDTGSAFQNCKAVINRIRQVWPKEYGGTFENKAQANYQPLLKDMAKAAKRARKHHEANDPSWTELYCLIEKVQALTQESQEDC